MNSKQSLMFPKSLKTMREIYHLSAKNFETCPTIMNEPREW